MIALDKKYHFIAGLIAFAVFQFLIVPVAANHGYELTPAWGIVFTGLLGWAKERLYDWYNTPPHTVEKADAWATCAGGAVGWVILTAIRALWVG